MRTVCAWFLFFVFLFGSFVLSGPRWWWDDEMVANTRDDSFHPDITIPMTYGPDVPLDVIIVVWQEIPHQDHDMEIFLTASFDMGCSFCEPVQITDNDVEDSLPSVAAGTLNYTDLMIQVAHQGDDPDSGDSHVYVTYMDAPWEVSLLSCGTLGDVGWTTIRMSELHAVDPDIAAATLENANGQQVSHFHLVWEESGVEEPGDIWHGVDLSGLGSYEAPVNITDTPSLNESSPAVNADSSPASGSPPASAVNVVYASELPIPEEGTAVFYRRSVDSGASLPIVPSERVSDDTSSLLPAIDTGQHHMFPLRSNWHGVSWLRSGGNGAVLGYEFLH